MPEADPPVVSPVPIMLESDTGIASNNLGYWLLLLCGGLLMLTTLFNSHATTDPVWLLIPADWLHLVSTGFWIGGLFYLALALPPALAALRPGTGDRTRLLSVLISNFSFIGIISVTLLLITGTIQAAIHLGALDVFFNTPYGIALFAKLVVVAILLLFGAYHLLMVSPALRGYARRKGEKNGAGSLAAGQVQAQFRKTVMVEALLGLVLLGIVGGLTSFGPPAENTTAKGGLDLKGQVADLSYVLRVDPAQIGNNNFDVSLTQNNGQLLTQVGAVLLRLNMVDMDMGVQELELKPVPNLPGHYQKQGYILSMSGQWQAELIVRRDGKEDARTPIQFKVN
jgi:copper transport protein